MNDEINTEQPLILQPQCVDCRFYDGFGACTEHGYQLRDNCEDFVDMNTINKYVDDMEDYKKKYKGALEKLQEALSPTEDGCKISGLTRGCIENIFPELKESEDEKIRKAIISGMIAIKDNQKKKTFAAIPLDDCIAWLEKQSEQDSPVDINKMVDEFAHTEVKGYGVPSMIEVDAYRKGIEDVLEKQGEQNFDYEHADIPQKDFAPIEPKFKVRDWLQYRHAEPFLVEEITEQGYCNGDSCLPFEWEDEIHLWTIQDAKNGDIVYFECHGNKHLFIVKSVGETKDHVEGHFWYDITRNECEVWDGRLPYSNIASMCDAMPATKEQRDLLFAKMKEAGYDWDAKNKTLWQTR